MSTVAAVFLDGTDVTEACVEGSVSRRLNRVSTASVRIQMKALADLFGTIPTAGAMLKVYFDNATLGGSTLWHHGRVLTREVTADQDSGYAVFNSSDPLELWAHRPVRDDDGDFSKPAIVDTYIYGPQIIEAMFNNSESAGGGPPADAEGPLRMALGTVTAGITPLYGAPVDWPMTMAELATLLVSTGTVDVVVTPIEFDGSNNYATLDLYPGNYGTDRHASVTLSYGMGDFSIMALRWNTDMTNLCNKLWYYLGPRVGTAADPPGDQHWQANITATMDMSDCDPCDQANDACNDIRDAVVAAQGTGVGSPGDSRGDYDVRMDIQIFDGDNVNQIAHCLYLNNWLRESWLRVYPRELVHVTPARDVGIGSFDIGDLITVEATADVAGGFSGVQRIYEYTISWDAADSVPAISELQVSSDNEGFGA